MVEEPQSTTKTPVLPEFLSGGGELGQRIREFDWSKTSLGPVETWPQSLRTCVRIMLTSRQPIWIGWGKELIKLYNDPYKTIVGGKHPWALGSPSAVVWKEIWEHIGVMLKKAMERGEGTYVESQLLVMHRNGYPEETYYTFSYTPIPGDDGRTAGIICANTDDTDRIISERQLRTLTALGKNLLNLQSDEEIISNTIESLKDNPHDFPYVLFYTLKGDKAVYAGSTSLGQAAAAIPTEIYLSGDSPLANAMRGTMKDRRPHLFNGVEQYIGPMPKGAWEVSSDKAIILPVMQAGSKEPYGFLLVGFNPYRLLDEKYSGFFNLIADQVATSFADVHVLKEERKRVEALAELDRAKTLFFSNISHEFRTPLTLLMSPLEDALNDPDVIPENKKRLDVAYRNGLRMQKLVNTLLEFSRIEAGRMDGKFERVDICTLTEDLVSTFRSAIEKAGMSLEIECHEVTGDVYVDPEMWERIILNLVSNAFKYSNDGTIKVTVREVDQELQVTISDTGVGIPEDQLEKIFDRFHRVENTQGRSQEGTGIGLAMVKELVRIHHGTIKVSSLPGKGSVFNLSIPLGKAHLPADKISDSEGRTFVYKHSAAFVEEALKWIPGEQSDDTMVDIPPQDSNGVPKHVVLLADDNTDMREYVQRLLSGQFTVITARDGEEALNKAIAAKPDLILSDIMMPKLDGFGLLKKLRNHPDLKTTPVIFLSARAGEEAKVEGLDAGADDYLVKPFSARELIVRISNHIRISQVRRETEQQFYQLFLQAPAMINVFRGPDFKYELFHPQNKEILGDVDFTGMSVRTVLPELGDQGVFEVMEQVYKTGDTIHLNEQPILFHRNGVKTQRYLNLTWQPWYDLRGGIQGVISFGIDVTEAVTARKKVEESERKYRELSEELEVKVETRTEELKRSNDDLQQFAHVASHDLKEPVRKFRTFINRLKEEFGDTLPETGKLYLNKMQNAAERMSAMITGVLKYASLNESEDITAVDLGEIIKNIESDLEVIIHQTHAQINKTRLPVVAGSSVLLYQLFYNLINNSLKFSDLVPVIDISTSTVVQNGREFAKIVIADQGIGFNQAFASRIFEAFTRLNSKDKYEGTGLGLALCKKIVERHHGTITAEGKEGEGAIFTITLPLAQSGKKV